MIPTALTPADLSAHCRRIAEIAGGGAMVYIGISSELWSRPHVSVYPADDRMRDGQMFTAPTWPEMFRAAEAYARGLWLKQHGADLEYDSWQAQPALPLAAE